MSNRHFPVQVDAVLPWPAPYGRASHVQICSLQICRAPVFVTIQEKKAFMSLRYGGLLCRTGTEFIESGRSRAVTTDFLSSRDTCPSLDVVHGLRGIHASMHISLRHHPRKEGLHVVEMWRLFYMEINLRHICLRFL